MHDFTSICCFTHHPYFTKELEEFISKHCLDDASADEAIKNIQNLLIQHFYKKNMKFTSKHLGLAQGFSGFTVYWLHLVIPNCNLSRTQLPKSYFYKTDNHICFLCLDSHIQNYKDAKLRSVGNERLKEMIDVLKTH